MFFKLKIPSKEESAQEGKAETLLHEMCEQISSWNYDEQMVRGVELFRAGMVFSEANRQLVGWCLV